MLRQGVTGTTTAVQHATFDCSAGTSGPTLLGALIDAGASVEAVEAAVETLGVGPVRLALGRVRRGGEAGLSVRVRAPVETPPVRSWRQVLRLAEFVALPDPVRDRTRRVLGRIATATGELLGEDPEAVDLHQLDALEMLSDVVAVVAALDDLGVESVTVGPVGVGTGELETAFGMVPLPGPLVQRLLAGFELQRHPVATELTTATGAGLLAELAAPAGTTGIATTGPPVPAADDPGPPRWGAGAGDRVTTQLVRVTLTGDGEVAGAR